MNARIKYSRAQDLLSIFTSVLDTAMICSDGFWFALFFSVKVNQTTGKTYVYQLIN